MRDLAGMLLDLAASPGDNTPANRRKPLGVFRMNLLNIVKLLLAAWLVVGVVTAVTGLVWTRRTSSRMLKEGKS
jgi:hypothetical protein